MAKNDFQYGGWNSYSLQCGTIMTLISPGDCTLQCGMWLWEHDREFTKWQHPATWYVALGRHAIEFPRLQHNVTRSSGIINNIEFPRWQHPATWQWQVYQRDMSLNSQKRPPYWNSTPGFDFDHITAVDTSFCTILRNFIKIGPPSAEKNDVMSIFRMGISAILDFLGPIMGSLKSPCRTSYRSSIETIAPNCLVFEKIAFFALWQQTD